MTQRTCPECHAEIPADAPPGVCPYCALRAGLRWEASTEADRRRGRATPLPPEELERRLPDLDGFELIGPGGMGTVYRARHRPLDRPVAVKVLHAHLQDDPAFAERFAREARTMARLDHPHIVRVYDFGDREGLYYLVMELVEGVTLRQAMASGSLAAAEALAIVPRICEALQYAHDQGVVHRDIKPENILLDRAGAPKIVDFGLALLTGSSTDTRLTEHARVLGTPHYMAPEQIEHPSQVDHRADIYALGVVFYEMLTGELPIGRFPPPSQKVEVDVRLDQVVLRTLEKEPRRRYQQASELRSDVRQSTVGEGLPARFGDATSPPDSRGATAELGVGCRLDAYTARMAPWPKAGRSDRIRIPFAAHRVGPAPGPRRPRRERRPRGLGARRRGDRRCSGGAGSDRRLRLRRGRAGRDDGRRRGRRRAGARPAVGHGRPGRRRLRGRGAGARRGGDRRATDLPARRVGPGHAMVVAGGVGAGHGRRHGARGGPDPLAAGSGRSAAASRHRPRRRRRGRYRRPRRELPAGTGPAPGTVGASARPPGTAGGNRR